MKTCIHVIVNHAYEKIPKLLSFVRLMVTSKKIVSISNHLTCYIS